MLLSLVGGALGLALAWVLVRLLVAASPQQLPRVQEITLDLRVLLFTLGVFASDRAALRARARHCRDASQPRPFPERKPDAAARRVSPTIACAAFRHLGGGFLSGSFLFCAGLLGRASCACSK